MLAAVVSLVVAAPAAGQAVGAIGRVPGVRLAAGEGRVLYVDARLVPPGRYFFGVRAVLARDGRADGTGLFFSPDRFRFVTPSGLVFGPASAGSPEGAGAGTEVPCSALYLAAGRTVTCDLVFQVPSDVIAGTLEFASTGLDVWRVPVRIPE